MRLTNKADPHPLSLRAVKSLTPQPTLARVHLTGRRRGLGAICGALVAAALVSRRLGLAAAACLIAILPADPVAAVAQSSAAPSPAPPSLAPQPGAAAAPPLPPVLPNRRSHAAGADANA